MVGNNPAISHHTHPSIMFRLKYAAGRVPAFTGNVTDSLKTSKNPIYTQVQIQGKGSKFLQNQMKLFTCLVSSIKNVYINI
jgi:hypothetical protein